MTMEKEGRLLGSNGWGEVGGGGAETFCYLRDIHTSSSLCPWFFFLTFSFPCCTKTYCPEFTILPSSRMGFRISHIYWTDSFWAWEEFFT